MWTQKETTILFRTQQIIYGLKGDDEFLFEVIKTRRKAAPTVPSMIDGVNNNIESHFANTYKQQYNSVDDNDDNEG